MKKLETIQKRNNLNDVYAIDEAGAGGASHEYIVVRAGECLDEKTAIGGIIFQHGSRNDPNSTHGCLDTDLLEIVRDRIAAFQRGEFATRENAIALTHIEETLLWMNKRVEDRAARGVLGTTQK